MYQSLISLVERSESAPSLREVARQLGVSVGALRYRFPRETEQIARAWQRRQVTVSNRRLGRVRNVVAECINQWGAQHRGPLTKKGLLRFLRATTDLPKEPLRRQIDFALTVLQARREISRRCLRQGIREPWNGIRKQPQVLNTMNGSRRTFRAAGGMRNELNAPATSKELCSGHRQSTDAHGPGQTCGSAT